jgi:tetratricopeptide (TPR) repeat protein
LVRAFSASFFAWTLAELGEFAEAETAGLMGVDLATQANHAYSISVASFGLGHVRLRQGRFADAIQILERGYEQTKLHNIDAVVDQVAFRLIYAYSRAGRIEEARALGQAMNPEVKRLNLFLSTAHFWLSVREFENDRIDAALRATREVYRADLRGEKPTVAWLEHSLGDLAVCTDPADASTAAEHYRAAAAIAVDLGMKPLLTECHVSLGQLARRAGRVQEAKSEFEAALELAESMGLEPVAERARKHLRDLN